ncbi:hypothetical protein [Xanthobacter versatilis]|uniref:hypothetical protein n=1 Tax=Xanthobacter autotrophicus (strain ATCC BAA-1158 / Py2) TaxID=78245 RepID=UPI003729396E
MQLARGDLDVEEAEYRDGRLRHQRIHITRPRQSVLVWLPIRTRIYPQNEIVKGKIIKAVPSRDGDRGQHEQDAEACRLAEAMDQNFHEKRLQCLWYGENKSRENYINYRKKWLE